VIRLLSDDDLNALFGHMSRHREESGNDGDVIFVPRSRDEPMDEAAFAQRHQQGWARSLAEPAWLRSWGLFVEGELLGHLELTGGRIPAELHRAMLGMGLERGARGRGQGRSLLDAAITWARAQALTWIDLGVFAHNAPARALYAAAGFVEVGAVRDQFRVDGTSIDDVSMTLAL
jgi:RimJ/RimL family protein N-acetyltransferase